MIERPTATRIRHPAAIRAAAATLAGRHLLSRILTAALLLHPMLGCKKEEPPAPPPPEVLVSEVVKKDVPIYGEWIGTTDGKINAQIRARVQGYLDSQHYAEGSLVRAGELLFVIDPRTYKAALDDAQGELGQAQAMLIKSEQDVARYTPLAKQGAVSQQELDDAIQAVAAGRARVESAKANVEQAKLNLGWTQVTSPIDGIAGISVAQIGDLIAPATVLTTVSQVDPIKVNFPISEQEYLKLAARIEKVVNGGQPAEEGRELELYLADGSKYPHLGRAAVADRQVDPTTGTITIVSYFPNPSNILRPGQFAKVRAVLDTNVGALVVPQRAVREQQGQYQVAVVAPDGKVQIRPVEAGDRTGSDWVITKGLQAGEQVIVEGMQKVAPGATVRAKPYAASGSPDGAASPAKPAA